MESVVSDHYKKLLQEIHHGNVSLKTIIKFRTEHPETPWNKIVYSKTGDSLLHVASRLGEVAITLYILDNWPPSNVDIKNNDCKTPLHESAQFSQPHIVNILLKYSAQVDAIKRADWTALMLACTKGGDESLETVSILLKANASCILKNKDGWTPIHLACRTGDIKIVKLLLKYNTKPIEMCTNNGRTLLHIACLHGHVDIAKLLIEMNAPINIQDKCGNTPLLDTVVSGSKEIFVLLLNAGSNINTCNKVGMGCLHIAAGAGLTDMLQFLIQDLNMNPNIRTDAGFSPLHCAARNKQKYAMEMLLHLGADVTIKDLHNRTADDYFKL